MSQPPDRRGSRSLAVAAIGQAFGAFMGLALGGRDLGPILAAGLASWGEKWMQDIAAEWTRKGNIVADAALTTSRINGAEQFFGVVIGDPRLIALMQQIAWAAAISGYEPKLQALGAFLGDAVARSDRLDETQLLVSALADIEKPHIAILEILTEAAPDDDKYAAKAAQQAEAARARAANPYSFSIPPHRDPGEAMAYEPGAWLPEDIQQKAPMDRRFVLACLSGLTRHNLVTAIGTLDGGSRFKITDLGATLVQVIRQSGPISQSGPESGA